MSGGVYKDYERGVTVLSRTFFILSLEDCKNDLGRYRAEKRDYERKYREKEYGGIEEEAWIVTRIEEFNDAIKRKKAEIRGLKDLLAAGIIDLIILKEEEERRRVEER